VGTSGSNRHLVHTKTTPQLPLQTPELSVQALVERTCMHVHFGSVVSCCNFASEASLGRSKSGNLLALSAGRGEIARTWYDGHICFLRYRIWSSQDSRVKRKRTGTHRKLWLWHRLDGVRRKEGKQSHVHSTCSLMVVSEEQQG